VKRPSFQFYPSDWLRDTALRTCSTGARGLWIDMICFMHEGTPYGHLKVGEKVILPSNLARMVGETLEQVEGWLEELKQASVFDIDERGTNVSRRMIRDEAIREARASGGKLGGNPLLTSRKDNLQNNLGDNQEVDVKDKQKPTPSSSSSSSSSASDVVAPKRRKQLPDDFYPDATGLNAAGQKGVDVSVELQKFRDYHSARGSVMLDWQAAWRTWVGNVRFTPATVSRQSALEARNAEVLRRYLAEKEDV